MAAHKLSNGAPGNTLQPTALVHEAWLRLAGGASARLFTGPTHFFATAAEAMRHILVDRARSKQSLRHGGGLQRLPLEDLQIAAPAPDEELLAVDDALDRLAAVDPAKAQLVKLRYFGGLSITEAAVALGISEPTANRRWALAKAWLYHEIGSTRR